MIRLVIKDMCEKGVVPNMFNVGYITPEEYKYICDRFGGEDNVPRHNKTNCPSSYRRKKDKSK